MREDAVDPAAAAAPTRGSRAPASGGPRTARAHESWLSAAPGAGGRARRPRNSPRARGGVADRVDAAMHAMQRAALHALADPASAQPEGDDLGRRREPVLPSASAERARSTGVWSSWSRCGAVVSVSPPESSAGCPCDGSTRDRYNCCANGAQDRARALDRLHRDRAGEGRVDPRRVARDHPGASGVESSARARIASRRASHDAASRAIHAAVSCSGAEHHDVAHLATVPLRGDQPGAVEDGEMLDHRRAAHGQLGGQGGRRAVPVLGQQVEDPSGGSGPRAR